jgi:hypothetical protein
MTSYSKLREASESSRVVEESTLSTDTPFTRSLRSFSELKKITQKRSATTMAPMIVFDRYRRKLFAPLLVLWSLVPSICNAQCHVREKDCSYGLRVSDSIFLQGAPVHLLLQGQWQPLACRGVTAIATSGSSSNSNNITTGWELDYDPLTLKIENRGSACVMSFTTQREIQVGSDDDGGGDGDSNKQQQVITTFPAFMVDNSQQQETSTSQPSPSSFTLDGRLSWQGSFMNPETTACTTGTRGGPCALFDISNPTHGNVVMLSALDHFLITSRTITFQAGPNNNNDTRQEQLIWGASTVGTIRKLPAGYTHSFVAMIGKDGVTDTIQQWGKFLQDFYKFQGRMSDLTIQTLGYQTDNGAQVKVLFLQKKRAQQLQCQSSYTRYCSFCSQWSAVLLLPKRLRPSLVGRNRPPPTKWGSNSVSLVSKCLVAYQWERSLVRFGLGLGTVTKDSDGSSRIFSSFESFTTSVLCALLLH